MDDVNDLVGTVTGKLQTWFLEFVSMLPNLAVATLVVVLFALAARYGARLTRSSLDRVSKHTELNSLFTHIVRITLLVLGIFIALGVLNLDKTVTSLLAGIGIIGLALGLAFQDLAGNFVSGVMLAVRRPVRVDDLVEVDGHFGTVALVNLRSTHLRKLTGERVIIPNRKVFENTLINFTVNGQRRLDLGVGVSYGDDLEKVREVTLAAVTGLPHRVPEREPEVFYEGFGDSSINFTLRLWLRETGQRFYLDARSEAVIAIKKAFDDNDITIPFPIRTLDFAPVGGETLDEVLGPFRGDFPERNGAHPSQTRSRPGS